MRARQFALLLAAACLLPSAVVVARHMPPFGRHALPTGGLISTVWAAIAPGALCAAACTLRQLPGVTSVNCAGPASVTMVFGLKSTVAAPPRVRSWITPAEVERTMPST